MSDSSFAKKKSDPQSQFRSFDIPEGDVVYPEAPARPQAPQELLQQKQAGYELSQAEREEMLRARKSGNKDAPIGDYARKRIEILANIGRLYRDVTVESITFGLRTLKAREAREAAVSITNCNSNIDAAFEMQRQNLARSIYMIDGQTIDDALGGSSLDLRLQLVEDMEDSVSSKLYEEFKSLRQEATDKYSITGVEVAQEVVEDLKK